MESRRETAFCPGFSSRAKEGHRLARRSQASDEANLFDTRATGGGNGGAAPPGPAPGNGNGDGDGDQQVALHEAAQTRYLNYALSVITSRALPDVRDGLKPVQRRILYAMWLRNLTFDAKHRKCADVVGTVMGNYHPHGDMAIYETLVRMAQPFSLRTPLIDGSGNFGSLDGDGAAAMRYTECRLARVSDTLLTELDQQTVHFRPNYDGRLMEPIVLPAQFCNLLVNGATGIAVGMATNIPPHNLGETCNALLKLLENEELDDYQLVANDAIQGPDFPTGGQLLNSRKELRDIYKEGSGSLRLRATWQPGPKSRSAKLLYITSIPYTVNKSTLVEQIGDIVLSRKLPLLTNVKDISTDDVRIELELKPDADEQMVLAYLFKHSQLQVNFAVNMTCLIPTENPELGKPLRCGLKEVLWYFLHFRLEVVTKRLEHELGNLQKRIHILEGFATVFDALDEIIRIIRKSEGKADAAQKIMDRFKLDAEQTDAILELKLYRLAKLEILVIQQELEEKQKRVKQIQGLLKNEKSRWNMVRDEITAIRDNFGKLPEGKRRTIIEEVTDEPEFTADDFIIAEDNVVIVTRDGWVKRQKEVKDLSTQRLREGDSILTAQPGSTRATIAFMSNFGVAYTCRIIDIPATTGYGEPIQKFFKLKDGEKIVQAVSMDERSLGDYKPAREGAEPKTHGLAVSSDGMALRFGLEPFVEPSTRAGRRYARPAGDATIVAMQVVHGKETVIVATRQARALLCPAKEINFLAGPGKGVTLIKLADDDVVLGVVIANDDRDTLVVRTSMGGEQRINTAKYETTSRGGRGREIVKRGHIETVVPDEPAIPAMLDEEQT
jgi:DNA gyrase subunit A